MVDERCLEGNVRRKGVKRSRQRAYSGWKSVVGGVREGGGCRTTCGPGMNNGRAWIEVSVDERCPKKAPFVV